MVTSAFVWHKNALLRSSRFGQSYRANVTHTVLNHRFITNNADTAKRACIMLSKIYRVICQQLCVRLYHINGGGSL